MGPRGRAGRASWSMAARAARTGKTGLWVCLLKWETWSPRLRWFAREPHPCPNFPTRFALSLRGWNEMSFCPRLKAVKQFFLHSTLRKFIRLTFGIVSKQGSPRNCFLVSSWFPCGTPFWACFNTKDGSTPDKSLPMNPDEAVVLAHHVGGPSGSALAGSELRVGLKASQKSVSSRSTCTSFQSQESSHPFQLWCAIFLQEAR